MGEGCVVKLIYIALSLLPRRGHAQNEVGHG